MDNKSLVYLPIERTVLLRLAGRVSQLSGSEPFVGDTDLQVGQLLQVVSTAAEYLAKQGDTICSLLTYRRIHKPSLPLECGSWFKLRRTMSEGNQKAGEEDWRSNAERGHTQVEVLIYEVNCCAEAERSIPSDHALLSRSYSPFLMQLQALVQ